MPSLKVDGNELVNIDIPDQFPGKVYREYNNTIQPGDGSNSENQKVSKKVAINLAFWKYKSYTAINTPGAILSKNVDFSFIWHM